MLILSSTSICNNIRFFHLNNFLYFNIKKKSHIHFLSSSNTNGLLVDRNILIFERIWLRTFNRGFRTFSLHAGNFSYLKDFDFGIYERFFKKVAISKHSNTIYKPYSRKRIIRFSRTRGFHQLNRVFTIFWFNECWLVWYVFFIQSFRSDVKIVLYSTLNGLVLSWSNIGYSFVGKKKRLSGDVVPKVYKKIIESIAKLPRASSLLRIRCFHFRYWKQIRRFRRFFYERFRFKVSKVYPLNTLKLNNINNKVRYFLKSIHKRRNHVQLNLKKRLFKISLHRKEKRSVRRAFKRIEIVSWWSYNGTRLRKKKRRKGGKGFRKTGR